MTGKIYDAFDTIQATTALQSSTIEFLQHVREKRHDHKKYPVNRNVLTAVSMLLLLIMGIGSYSLLQVPVSYISIDVNPSVELTLNQFDRVVAATPYNDAGQLVLEDVSVKGKHYTDAIDNIVEGEAMAAYLSDPAGLTFTVASQSSTKESELISGIESCAGCMSHRGRCTNADAGTVRAAHENGLSLGKYTAYLELSQYDATITIEDCKHMSMSAMHQQINTYKKGGNHGEPRCAEADNRANNEEHKRMHGGSV